MLLSVHQGKEEARSSSRGGLSLAGRQGGLLGSPDQLSGGSSLFRVKSQAFAAGAAGDGGVWMYEACLVIPDGSRIP